MMGKVRKTKVVFWVDSQAKLLTDFAGTISRERNIRCMYFDCAEDLFSALDNGFLPDLIIMGIRLPNITGLEASKIIKRDESLKHLPIILTSGTFPKILGCVDILS